MQHEDGGSVALPAAKGIAKLVVVIVHISNLHTQGSTPIPGNKKNATKEKNRSTAITAQEQGNTILVLLCCG